MKSIALITGATAGIGKATAYKFASEGWNVIISGRRKDRLKSLQKELESQYKVKVLPLCFDVRENKQVKKALSGLDKKWENISLLVNNAGLASGLDLFQEADLDDWEKMIDTNVKGLLYVSRIIAPMMAGRGKGHIINVGSLAGKEVYPRGNVYTATKHAVDALTRAMRIDLIEKGVKVSQVAPGLVDTEFSTVRFHGDKEKADKVYEGFRPLSGEDIAEIIFFMSTVPDHVNLADALVLPAAQATSTIVNKKP